MWKSNGISRESIGNITKSDLNFASTFVDHHLLPRMNFNERCLIKTNFSITKKVINLYISYTLTPWLRNLNSDFALDNCFFGFAKLTKNADPDKFKSSGYAIGFDSRSEFSLPDGIMGRNVIIFGVDLSSSVHVENKKRHFYEVSTQGLDDTTLTAEVKYPINFTHENKRFVLSLHYNGSNSF